MLGLTFLLVSTLLMALCCRSTVMPLTHFPSLPLTFPHFPSLSCWCPPCSWLCAVDRRSEMPLTHFPSLSLTSTHLPSLPLTFHSISLTFLLVSTLLMALCSVDRRSCHSLTFPHFHSACAISQNTSGFDITVDRTSFRTMHTLKAEKLHS